MADYEDDDYEEGEFDSRVRVYHQKLLELREIECTCNPQTLFTSTPDGISVVSFCAGGSATRGRNKPHAVDARLAHDTNRDDSAPEKLTFTVDKITRSVKSRPSGNVVEVRVNVTGEDDQLLSTNAKAKAFMLFLNYPETETQQSRVVFDFATEWVNYAISVMQTILDANKHRDPCKMRHSKGGSTEHASAHSPPRGAAGGGGAGGDENEEFRKQKKAVGYAAADMVEIAVGGGLPRPKIKTWGVRVDAAGKKLPVIKLTWREGVAQPALKKWRHAITLNDKTGAARYRGDVHFGENPPCIYFFLAHPEEFVAQIKKLTIEGVGAERIAELEKEASEIRESRALSTADAAAAGDPETHAAHVLAAKTLGAGLRRVERKIIAEHERIIEELEEEAQCLSEKIKEAVALDHGADLADEWRELGAVAEKLVTQNEQVLVSLHQQESRDVLRLAQAQTDLFEALNALERVKKGEVFQNEDEYWEEKLAEHEASRNGGGGPLQASPPLTFGSGAVTLVPVRDSRGKLLHFLDATPGRGGVRVDLQDAAAHVHNAVVAGVEFGGWLGPTVLETENVEKARQALDLARRAERHAQESLEGASRAEAAVKTKASRVADACAQRIAAAEGAVEKNKWCLEKRKKKVEALRQAREECERQSAVQKAFIRAAEENTAQKLRALELARAATAEAQKAYDEARKAAESPWEKVARLWRERGAGTRGGN